MLLLLRRLGPTGLSDQPFARDEVLLPFLPLHLHVVRAIPERLVVVDVGLAGVRIERGAERRQIEPQPGGVQLQRRAFEVAIAPLLARVDAALTTVLERSGVRAGEIIEIVCTGGSSAIPAARTLLRKRFENAELRDAAAHTAVAAGLARA